MTKNTLGQLLHSSFLNIMSKAAITQEPDVRYAPPRVQTRHLVLCLGDAPRGVVIKKPTKDIILYGTSVDQYWSKVCGEI